MRRLTFHVWVYGQVMSIDSYFKKFAYNEYRKLTSSSELEEFVKGLLQEMIRFKPNTQQRDAEVGNKYVLAGNKKNEKDELVMTVSELEDLLETIKRDPQQIVYTKESINQTLRKEFERQVQPIRGQNGSSVISLTDGDKVYFSLTIENNNVVDDTKTKFMARQYKKVYLVDDPFILDNLERDQKLNQSYLFSYEEPQFRTYFIS